MEPIPTHQTITAVNNGGLMLGAFYEGDLVGFNYGFPGFANEKSYLCSHILGIHPDFQEKGIGAKLKSEQKKAASEIGYDMITWTFDPLESRNAFLNFTKLRAICSVYAEDCYGKMEDGLNSGLPTDRFKVEWWIDSQHVQTGDDFTNGERLTIAEWELTGKAFPRLVEIDSGLRNLGSQEKLLTLPVPANFQMIKKEDAELAIDWRLKTRKIFQSLFGQGYAAVFLEKNKNGPVHHYVLVKRKSLNVTRREKGAE